MHPCSRARVPRRPVAAEARHWRARRARRAVPAACGLRSAGVISNVTRTRTRAAYAAASCAGCRAWKLSRSAQRAQSAHRSPVTEPGRQAARPVGQRHRRAARAARAHGANWAPPSPLLHVACPRLDLWTETACVAKDGAGGRPGGQTRQLRARLGACRMPHATGSTAARRGQGAGSGTRRPVAAAGRAGLGAVTHALQPPALARSRSSCVVRRAPPGLAWPGPLPGASRHCPYVHKSMRARAQPSPAQDRKSVV